MCRVVRFMSLCATLLVCELVWSAPYCTSICHPGFTYDGGSRNCFNSPVGGTIGVASCLLSTCSVKLEAVHEGCNSNNQEPTAVERTEVENIVRITWMNDAPCQYNFLTSTCYCPAPNMFEIFDYRSRTCATSPCDVGG